MTPKKQSPLSLGTTCSGLTGMLTMPALASETHSENTTVAAAVNFILTEWY